MKLRLAPNKVPIRAGDQTIAGELRDSFARLVERTTDALRKSVPFDTELNVGPLQFETNARDLMTGAKTYFSAQTSEPEKLRAIVRRLAFETEARLRPRYGRSLRIEVSEVWGRPDGEHSG
jgi:hypothetical protein